MTPDPKTEALKPCPKLEPCPLCGGISSWALKRYANTGQLHGHKIRCESCGLEIESDVSFWTDGEEGRILKLEQSRIELAIRWNTRAPAIERDAEVAAMREALKECEWVQHTNDDGMAWSECPSCGSDAPKHSIDCKLSKALASTAGTDFAEWFRKAVGERDAAIREREACHNLFDQVLALFGYEKGQSYPGIVGAAEKMKEALAAVTAERDALAKAIQDAVDSLQEGSDQRAFKTLASALKGAE